VGRSKRTMVPAAGDEPLVDGRQLCCVSTGHFWW
jgi:hypothetical protein